MWLKESDRPKHLLYAIPCGFIGSILFVLGLALGMEFKDKKYGGKFDWLDIAATCIGGVIGQAIQSVFIYGIITENNVISFTIVVLTIVTVLVSGILYMISD